ncbi:MAG: UDP-N-acetylmuramoyl-L-alanine--D-glutamate ligase [Kiritimatiellae bacterium]|nr:UDP-N-acetylmuramoyl-L-alanine--D-glutamate ligase [Kiritimatiellia bacterium]
MNKYPHALVLGLGKSGEASARLLLSEGSHVTILDGEGAGEVRARGKELVKMGARVLLGAGGVPSGEFDVCIVSPGVALSNPWVGAARERGIPLVSELELGWSRCRGPVLAVTGSNGKSTVVKWCCEALQTSGSRARLAGNYGEPIAAAVAEGPEADPWVLEVSSFQLETVREFRADVGVLLNLNPNHLDRHGDMQTYTAMKARLFARAKETDTCVVPQALLPSLRELSGGRGRWLTFGATGGADYVYRPGAVLSGDAVVARLDGTLFDNGVMGPSAAAAVAALAVFGVSGEDAESALRRMKPLPHRMQKVAEARGVVFVDDSKATNLAALAAALRMAKGPVRLIAGGLAKEKDFAAVTDVLARRVESVYLIGASSADMAAAWSAAVPCRSCGTLDVAVRRAYDDARSGETILLSPGCASFDQFRNFEERGQCFIKMVKSLAEEEPKWKIECPGT